MRKVTSAWDTAVNIHSSGHAHGSNDTHEDSVALLFDVLAKIHSNKHGQTDREGDLEYMSGCWFSFVTSRQMLCRALGSVPCFHVASSPSKMSLKLPVKLFCYKE